MQISEAQSDAAGQIVDLIVNRLGEGRAVHPETAIASAARIAGSFLLSSFGLELKDCTPGTFVLSEQANEKGPHLVSILGGMLELMKVPLDAQRLNAQPAARGEQPTLNTLETLELFRDGALKIARDKGLTLEEAAQAAAVATAFIVRECSTTIGAEVGFNAAAFGFIEGAKTVPPLAGVMSARAKWPWYKLW